MEKIFRKKEKKKNISTASDIPLGNNRNGLLVPLTDFTAVVGEIGQWWQCPQLSILCQPRQGPKASHQYGWCQGTQNWPSITWSKSRATGSICVSFAIMLHFPACRQLTKQMSLKWLNVLSCYLFNSDVENVSHLK